MISSIFQVPLIDSEILSNLMDSGMGPTTTLGNTAVGSSSTVGTQCPSTSSSRRESTMSCDSGYYLSLPSSRRASSLSDPISRRDSAMSECGDNLSSFMLPHDTCGVGPVTTTTTSCCTVATAASSTAAAISRRDSNMSNDSGAGSFLSVESARQAGSVSSGCPSDGSTDSLVEQDLRNLSLSVTEKLWNE